MSSSNQPRSIRSLSTILTLLFLASILLCSSFVNASALYDPSESKDVKASDLKDFGRRIRIGVVVPNEGTRKKVDGAAHGRKLERRQVIPNPLTTTTVPVTTVPPTTVPPAVSPTTASPTTSPVASPTTGTTISTTTTAAITTTTAAGNPNQSTTTSHTSTSATASPTAPPSTSGSSSGGSSSTKIIIICAIAGGGGLVAALVGIFIFRKAALRPSNNFKARMMRDEYGPQDPPTAGSVVSGNRPSVSGRLSPTNNRKHWMELNETAPPQPHPIAGAGGYDMGLHRADTQTTAYSGYAGYEGGYDPNAQYAYYGGAPPAPGSAVGAYGYADPYAGGMASPVPGQHPGYGDPYGGAHAYPPPPASTAGSNPGVTRY
ncbi:hypothetical protein HDV00_006855 [Rhizophlyctis rosea]|nr:hypothetical protein HDV00_006855 [Rhizophlyctis rosea]